MGLGLPLQQNGCGGADQPQPFIIQPQFLIANLIRVDATRL
jgi:hypothetical protein